MNIKCPKCGKIIIDVDKKAASTTCPRCKAEIDFKAIKKDVNKKSAKKSMIFAGISALIILFVFGVSTIAFALHKDDPVHVREKEVDIEELKRKNETLSRKYNVLKKKAARYDHIMEMFVSPKNGKMFLNRQNIKEDKKSYKGYFVHDTTYFTYRNKIC